MSIARSFFNELRPLFRMLEEPFGRSPAYMPFPQMRSMLEDPFFASPQALRPPVDVTDAGDKYVVEAELPGVKKDNVNVRIGDGGRSITIEGKVADKKAEAPAAGAEGLTEAAKQITSERSFVGTSQFTRTVWLPRPVDPTAVSAKLNDGVLTLTVPKANDPAAVEIPVQ